MMTRFTGVLFVTVLVFGQEPPRETLTANPRDSLAHFRLGEIQFQQHQFQSAANEFREALKGEPHSRWIDAWSHFDLGEIFDITGQRDRAVREYHMAAQTGDNTENVQTLVAERQRQAATAQDIKREGILARYLSVPKVMTRVTPVYSPEARVAELEGTVTLVATIVPDGSVSDLRVVSPLGLGLDESARAAAVQWSFEPGRTKDGPAPMLTTIELSFLFPSKRSRWHLLGVVFGTPGDTSRPHFVSAKYPSGSGIGAEAADQAHLIAAMGRQEFVQLSFDIDRAGHPVHFTVQKANAPWGKEAIYFVSAWRFSPASKNGIPVSIPCSIDLVWGQKQFVESSLQWASEAFGLDAIRRSAP